MRVLFLARDLDSPSHEWMRRMARGLGPDLTLIAADRPAPTAAASGLPVHVLPVPPLWSQVVGALGLLGDSPWNRLRGAAIESLIARHSIDCVLVHFLTTAVRYHEAWVRCAKPVVVHCHGYDVTWDHRGDNGRPTHARNYIGRVRALPPNVSFIANSLATKRRLTSIGIPEERIDVKYLGVTVPPEPRVHESKEECTLVCVGRLIDCKGPDLLIQAFDLACRQGLRGRLVLAGDGPLWRACRRLKARSPFSDRIELLGAVNASTVEHLLQQADIFTAHHRLGPKTHQEEAFGVSIVEAMAMGLPIVTGRSGSLPEIVEHEQDGILVEPGDLRGHANALVRLANSPELRSQMGKHAWERARTMFTLEQEMNTLREILTARSNAGPANIVGPPGKSHAYFQT